MMNIALADLDWKNIQLQLDRKGYFLIKHLVDHSTCDGWIQSFEAPNCYRKTVIMERHRFGKGSYKYFDHPLPSNLSAIRTEVYPYLVETANKWMRILKIDRQYPVSHRDFLEQCHVAGQRKATPLILKYGEGGYNTLHQDLYGDIYFPLQLVIFLSEHGKEYKGGEFVMTEQVPRSQSKASVIQPAKGDGLIFATSFRPLKGQRGYYRVNLRHGVSEVTFGNRYTLGVIFHDALN